MRPKTHTGKPMSFRTSSACLSVGRGICSNEESPPAADGSPCYNITGQAVPAMTVAWACKASYKDCLRQMFT